MLVISVFLDQQLPDQSVLTLIPLPVLLLIPIVHAQIMVFLFL
jgi:hypothetical protein